MMGAMHRSRPSKCSISPESKNTVHTFLADIRSSRLSTCVGVPSLKVAPEQMQPFVLLWHLNLPLLAAIHRCHTNSTVFPTKISCFLLLGPPSFPPLSPDAPHDSGPFSPPWLNPRVQLRPTPQEYCVRSLQSDARLTPDSEFRLQPNFPHRAVHWNGRAKTGLGEARTEGVEKDRVIMAPARLC